MSDRIKNIYKKQIEFLFKKKLENAIKTYNHETVTDGKVTTKS